MGRGYGSATIPVNLTLVTGTVTEPLRRRAIGRTAAH
jgi:hypothetical protein